MARLGSPRASRTSCRFATSLPGGDTFGPPKPVPRHPPSRPWPRRAACALLRLEGAVVLGAALAAYAQFGAGWGVFALWLLVPDLSLLGYLAGPRTGAALYNAAHSYVGPVLLLALGVLAAMPWAVAGSLIWLAHIGVDRALGYGLKYAAGFAATHLGRIGRADPW